MASPNDAAVPQPKKIKIVNSDLNEVFASAANPNIQVPTTMGGNSLDTEELNSAELIRLIEAVQQPQQTDSFNNTTMDTDYFSDFGEDVSMLEYEDDDDFNSILFQSIVDQEDDFGAVNDSAAVNMDIDGAAAYSADFGAVNRGLVNVDVDSTTADGVDFRVDNKRRRIERIYDPLPLPEEQFTSPTVEMDAEFFAPNEAINQALLPNLEPTPPMPPPPPPEGNDPDGNGDVGGDGDDGGGGGGDDNNGGGGGDDGDDGGDDGDDGDDGGGGGGGGPRKSNNSSRNYRRCRKNESKIAIWFPDQLVNNSILRVPRYEEFWLSGLIDRAYNRERYLLSSELFINTLVEYSTAKFSSLRFIPNVSTAPQLKELLIPLPVLLTHVKFRPNTDAAAANSVDSRNETPMTARRRKRLADLARAQQRRMKNIVSTWQRFFGNLFGKVLINTYRLYATCEILGITLDSDYKLIEALNIVLQLTLTSSLHCSPFLSLELERFQLNLDVGSSFGLATGKPKCPPPAPTKWPPSKVAAPPTGSKEKMKLVEKVDEPRAGVSKVAADVAAAVAAAEATVPVVLAANTAGVAAAVDPDVVPVNIDDAGEIQELTASGNAFNSEALVAVDGNAVAAAAPTAAPVVDAVAPPITGSSGGRGGVTNSNGVAGAGTARADILPPSGALDWNSGASAGSIRSVDDIAFVSAVTEANGSERTFDRNSIVVNSIPYRGDAAGGNNADEEALVRPAEVNNPPPVVVAAGEPAAVAAEAAATPPAVDNRRPAMVSTDFDRFGMITCKLPASIATNPAKVNQLINRVINNLNNPLVMEYLNLLLIDKQFTVYNVSTRQKIVMRKNYRFDEKQATGSGIGLANGGSQNAHRPTERAYNVYGDIQPCRNYTFTYNHNDMTLISIGY